MGDKISYKPADIEEVANTVCPDIANFYDDIGSKAATTGRGRDGAFGDHRLAEVWNDLFNLYYEIIHETGQNVRTLGPTLLAIANDQEILEGELVQEFSNQETAIEENGYTSSTSENYETTPTQAPDPDPDPEHKDENPYADQLGNGSGPI